MMTRDDVAMVYNTILNTPYMKENVKVIGKISRKAVLLLHHVIELGLASRKSDKAPALLSHLPDEIFEELKLLADESLQEAQLIETSENLKKLHSEK